MPIKRKAPPPPPVMPVSMYTDEGIEFELEMTQEGVVFKTDTPVTEFTLTRADIVELRKEAVPSALRGVKRGPRKRLEAVPDLDEQAA